MADTSTRIYKFCQSYSSRYPIVLWLHELKNLAQYIFVNNENVHKASTSTFTVFTTYGEQWWLLNTFPSTSFIIQSWNDFHYRFPLWLLLPQMFSGKRKLLAIQDHYVTNTILVEQTQGFQEVASRVRIHHKRISNIHRLCIDVLW